LREGEEVLSHGLRAELTRISVQPNEQEPEVGWPCVVTFRAGASEQEYSYSSMFGKQAGSARLQRIPPTLAPHDIATSSNAVSPKTRVLVRMHAENVCPISPCKRDSMRKHVGPRVWATRQALILMFPIYTLMALFFAEHGEDLVKPSTYRQILHEDVWNLKHAYRETCMCRLCFNLRCYREAMAVVARLLQLIVAPPQTDADDDSAIPPPPDPAVTKLLDVCNARDAGRRRSTTELICADCIDDADLNCVRGQCTKCSFTTL